MLGCPLEFRNPCLLDLDIQGFMKKLARFVGFGYQGFHENLAIPDGNSTNAPQLEFLSEIPTNK